MSLFLAFMAVLFGLSAFRDRNPLDRPKSDATKGRQLDVEDARKLLIGRLITAVGEAQTKGDSRKAAEHADELARLGVEVVAHVLDALQRTREWNTRISLLDVLGRVRHAESAEALRSFYATAGATEVALKREAVRRIGRIGGSPSKAILCALLGAESDGTLRAEISQTLLTIGVSQEEVARLDKKDQDLLASGLARRDMVVAQLTAVGKLDPKEEASLAPLESAALKEQTIAVSLAAFAKLEERGDGKAARILIERAERSASTDTDRVLQTNAIASLARMKSGEVRALFRTFALAAAPELRAQIVDLVGSFGDEAMLPLVDELVALDNSPPVLEAAKRARTSLRARTGVKTSTKQ